jgi:O-antigen/teichoic acid export membrane protein
VRAASILGPQLTRLRTWSLAKSAASAGLMRVLTLPVTALAGLATTHILVSAYGSDGFGLYSLVAFLPLLLPVADLGAGAAVVDAVARRELLGTDGMSTILRRATKRLGLAGAGLAIISILLGATESWHHILGTGAQASVDLAAAASLATFGMAMPLSLGLRVLQGLERTHTAVLIQAGTPCWVLVGMIFAVKSGAPIALAACIPSLSGVLTGTVASIVSARKVRHQARLESQLSLPRGLPLSGAFIVISLALPMTFQTDRIVLAHASDLTSVAIYSAGSQLWAPCSAIVVAAGQGLWPVFTRRRNSQDGLTRENILRAVAAFCGVGACLAIALVALGPPITSWATHGDAAASHYLMATFGLLLFATAVQYPGGVFLLDPEGARFQARWAFLMALANLPAAFALARWIGPAGVVLASATLSLAMMSLPVYVRIHRQFKAREGGVLFADRG